MNKDSDIIIAELTAQIAELRQVIRKINEELGEVRGELKGIKWAFYTTVGLLALNLIKLLW